MTSERWAVVIAAALCSLGCGEAMNPGDGRGAAPGETPGTGSYSDAGRRIVSGTAPDASTNVPGEVTVPGEGSVQSCRHVDIVFSVDPSGSMREELEFVRSTIFPALAEALRTAPNIDDFRVGVMDSCWDPPAFHTEGRDGACTFSSGRTWMESTSPALLDEFSCVGNLHGEKDDGYRNVSNCTGSDSDNEHPATAAMYALEAAAPGGANEGFLREDAVLVVFALTDEDEQPRKGPGQLSADEIFQGIVDARGGDPRAVAFLGVGGATDCDGVYGSAEEAKLLKQITARFAAYDRGLFWDLCGGNLEAGLARVIELIQRACDDLLDPCSEFNPDADLTGCYPYADGGAPDAGPPLEEPPLI